MREELSLDSSCAVVGAASLRRDVESHLFEKTMWSEGGDSSWSFSFTLYLSSAFGSEEDQANSSSPLPPLLQVFTLPESEVLVRIPGAG